MTPKLRHIPVVDQTENDFGQIIFNVSNFRNI